MFKSALTCKWLIILLFHILLLVDYRWIASVSTRTLMLRENSKLVVLMQISWKRKARHVGSLAWGIETRVLDCSSFCLDQSDPLIRSLVCADRCASCLAAYRRLYARTISTARCGIAYPPQCAAGHSLILALLAVGPAVTCGSPRGVPHTLPH